MRDAGEAGLIPGSGRSIPWRRKWQPTPVFLPGKSHGWRSLVGYSPWGCKESDMAEHACSHRKGSPRVAGVEYFSPSYSLFYSAFSWLLPYIYKLYNPSPDFVNKVLLEHSAPLHVCTVRGGCFLVTSAVEQMSQRS